MTAGFDVFVHEVIAAITTAPWPRWKVSPSYVTSTDVGSTRTTRGLVETSAFAGFGRAARRGRRERVAGRERLGDGLVVPVSVVHPEARKRVDERTLRVAQRHAVLRASWSRERRLDRREIELDHLRVRRRLVGVVPERVLLAVRLDERDPLVRATREPQVAERLVVHGEEAARRPVLRRHVPDRRAVRERERLQPVAEVLDELPDDAGLAQDLRDREHEVGRGGSFRERARQPESDDLRARASRSARRASRPRPRSRRRPNRARRGR